MSFQVTIGVWRGKDKWRIHEKISVTAGDFCELFERVDHHMNGVLDGRWIQVDARMHGSPIPRHYIKHESFQPSETFDCEIRYVPVKRYQEYVRHVTGTDVVIGIASDSE